MVGTVPDILARIVEQKRLELAELRLRRASLEREAAESVHARRNFRRALQSRSPALIAEVKKASPSKGLLAPSFDPVANAVAYEQGGAVAVSVLTDREFFQGSLEDLQAARAGIGLPVLRKDFTIDEVHVLEAAAHGADAILLIAAILTEAEMRRLRELAEQFELTALVEVHTREELAPALASGATVIGVNNRDLHTFEVSLETSFRLGAEMPDNVLKVSESGIRERAQIRHLQAAGFHAFLVGEHLMRSGNPQSALQSLLA
jgi:indole-3-glycerol phosphate synthase